MTRVPIYAQAQDVCNFLRMKNADGSPFTIGAGTDPTQAYVESLIYSTEDEIDRRTMHTWMAATAPRVSDIENHDLPVDYEWSWGTPIHLGHRMIQTIDSTKGDFIQVWNGTAYDDYTSGSGSTWNLQQDKGVLYFLGYLFAPIRTNRIRVQYRYGDSVVPQDIWLATLKKVASILIETSLTTNQFTFGTDRGVNMSNMLSKWQDDFDDMIARYAEMVASDYGF